MIRLEKMHKSALLIICFILLNLFFISSYAHAQSPEVTNGLNWLKSNQNADGSWGDLNNLRDTTTVIDTYRILEESDGSYLNAVHWINGASIESNDYIARKIISLAETGTDVTSDVQQLISYQNSDGGWGYLQGYGSNVYDTVMVLHALKAAQYQSNESIAKSINCLISKQNTDGSWSFLPDVYSCA